MCIMTMKPDFTKSDREFLFACPKGKWFREDDMILFRRYRYLLSRLAELGGAEWRAVGPIEHLSREYRIKDDR
jgi:hypothetical protein